MKILSEDVPKLGDKIRQLQKKACLLAHAFRRGLAAWWFLTVKLYGIRLIRVTVLVFFIFFAFIVAVSVNYVGMKPAAPEQIAAAVAAGVLYWVSVFLLAGSRGMKVVGVLTMQIVFMVLCALVYSDVGLHRQTDIVHDFGTALYFSVMTWTTVGHGNLQVEGLVRGVEACEAWLGYAGMGLLIALLLRWLLLGKRKALSLKEFRAFLRDTNRPENNA